MSYLQKSRQRFSSRRRTLVVVTVCVALLFAMNASVPNALSRTLSVLAAPFLSFSAHIGDTVLGFRVFVTSKQTLLNENTRLVADLADARTKLSLLDASLKENADLKALWGRGGASQKRLLAAVLQKPPATLYDTLILDAGEHEGVSVGDEIFASGVLLGRIIEVYPAGSKALLYSSAGEKIGVAIGVAGIRKDAFGRGNGNFAVEVPKGASVFGGDVVVRPALSSTLVGVVGTVESREADFMKIVLFRSPINIAELSFVEIIIAQ